MEIEQTIGDIYEEIAEQLAQARTKALMGERQEAQGLFQKASLDYQRFRDALATYPGAHALEHSLGATLQVLCGEQMRAEISEGDAAADAREAARPRRRSRKAA